MYEKCESSLDITVIHSIQTMDHTKGALDVRRDRRRRPLRRRPHRDAARASPVAGSCCWSAPTFPRDTLSTHYIHQSGVARLARWGLLERLAATGCPPIRRYRFDVGPFALTGSPPPIDGVDAAYSPRRHVLDRMLADAAAEAGAEVRERRHGRAAC